MLERVNYWQAIINFGQGEGRSGSTPALGTKTQYHAQMVELVDTQDLKSCSRKRSAGSIPALSTFRIEQEAWYENIGLCC